MRITESRLRRIIHEEAKRVLREQEDGAIGPEVAPSGTESFPMGEDAAALNDQLTQFAKKLRAELIPKYQGLYLHHCVFTDPKNNRQAIGFAVTGVPDNMLSTVALEVQNTQGLPQGVQFVPGTIAVKINELQGRTWKIMTDQGKGEQKAWVVRTNISPRTAGTLWGGLMGGYNSY